MTICTPAFFAAAAMEAMIFSSSPRGRPSSMMKEQLRYRGSPPHMAMSFTVPQTESFPMSPPGKKRGLTTKLSVEKTSFSPPGRMAPSPNAARAGLSMAGTIYCSISREVFFPPLP